jgi:hypothetical protein
MNPRCACAALLVVTLLAAACTGTSVVVRPDPNTLPASTSKRFSSVGIKDVPPARVYPPAGNPVAGFALAVERSGVAEKVFYPPRPDDQTDATLDTKIDVTFDPHTGASFAKAFFTGFTLFLLEPIFWYDFDYVLSGNVEVIRPSGSRLTLNAAAAATMSAKWLSLSQVQNLEGETLTKAKDSLYRQLLGQLSQVPSPTTDPPVDGGAAR